MNRASSCAVASLLALLIAGATPALAQSSYHVSLGVGSAGLESPALLAAVGPATVPTLAVGFRSSRGHGVELRASRIDVAGKEALSFPYAAATAEPTVCCGGGPVYATFGVRAVPVELGYFFQPVNGTSRLRPRFGLSVIGAHITDHATIIDPVDRESHWRLGVGGTVGVAARLVGATSLLARAGYQHFDDGNRPELHVGLSGSRLDAGLEVGF